MPSSDCTSTCLRAHSKPGFSAGLLGSAMLLLSSGCSSLPSILPRGPIPGIAGSFGPTSESDAAGSVESVRVLLVHGIGCHRAGWSYELQRNLLRELGLIIDRGPSRIPNETPIDDWQVLEYEPAAGVPTLATSRHGGALPASSTVRPCAAGVEEPDPLDRPSLTLRSFRLPHRGTIRFYELTWSSLAERAKARLLIAGQTPGPNSPPLPGFAKGAAFNRTIKNTLIDSKFADAIYYLGGRREEVLSLVRDALCRLTATPDQFGEQACLPSGDTARQRYVLITESLGSRIVFDALASHRMGGAAKGLLARTAAVFMLANQMPLFELASPPTPGLRLPVLATASVDAWFERHFPGHSAPAPSAEQCTRAAGDAPNPRDLAAAVRADAEATAGCASLRLDRDVACAHLESAKGDEAKAQKARDRLRSAVAERDAEVVRLDSQLNAASVQITPLEGQLLDANARRHKADQALEAARRTQRPLDAEITRLQGLLDGARTDLGSAARTARQSAQELNQVIGLQLDRLDVLRTKVEHLQDLDLNESGRTQIGSQTTLERLLSSEGDLRRARGALRDSLDVLARAHSLIERARGPYSPALTSAVTLDARLKEGISAIGTEGSRPKRRCSFLRIPLPCDKEDVLAALSAITDVGSRIAEGTLQVRRSACALVGTLGGDSDSEKSKHCSEPRSLARAPTLTSALATESAASADVVSASKSAAAGRVSVGAAKQEASAADEDYQGLHSDRESLDRKLGDLKSSLDAKQASADAARAALAEAQQALLEASEATARARVDCEATKATGLIAFDRLALTQPLDIRRLLCDHIEGRIDWLRRDGVSADALAPIAHTVKNLRSGERSERLQVVAISDPNDLLSYRLSRELECDIKFVRFQNVLMPGAREFLGLIANPVAAHESYVRSASVAALIAFGIGGPEPTPTDIRDEEDTCPFDQPPTY